MYARKKRILEEVLPLKLIRAVERWPVLYMKDCPERNNQHFKNKVWHEVAKGLIDNWDTLSQTDKDQKCVALNRKWRHLRDAFKRQLLLDKKARQGERVTRKEYIYFKYMTFLMPHVSVDDDEPERGADAAAGSGRGRRAKPADAAHARRDQPEELDEDEHFLMSLVPSLKRMTDDEKLTAKMNILRVIKEVRAGAGAAAAAPPAPVAAVAVGPPPLMEVDAVFDFQEDRLLVKKEPLAVDDDNSASEYSTGTNADTD